jgi:hypothetical protein
MVFGVVMANERVSMSEISHKSIAAQTYNACWDLLERPRTPSEDLALIELAYTSRYHWKQIGGPQEWAISDWMVSRVYATLGHATLAVAHAAAAHAHDARAFPTWLIASLHEGSARAALIANDLASCDESISAARTALASESDPADAAYIQQQLDEVIGVRHAGNHTPHERQ